MAWTQACGARDAIQRSINVRFAIRADTRVIMLTSFECEEEVRRASLRSEEE